MSLDPEQAARVARVLGEALPYIRRFGGKTVVYLEPLALALSRKCNQPVKMVMSRSETFRSTGPASTRKPIRSSGVSWRRLRATSVC